MTIKQSIMKLLSDGKERHWSVIAKAIKRNPTSVIAMLKQLKRDGELNNPIIIVEKTKRGFYQVIRYAVSYGHPHMRHPLDEKIEREWAEAVKKVLTDAKKTKDNNDYEA